MPRARHSSRSSVDAGKVKLNELGKGGSQNSRNWSKGGKNYHGMAC